MGEKTIFEQRGMLVIAVLLCTLVSVEARVLPDLPRGDRRIEKWHAFINDPKNSRLPIEEKLQEIDRFCDSLYVYMTDEESTGVKDYWQTPMRTLKFGYADCEDASILKYFTARALGVPMDNLRIMYVKYSRIAHMVLAYHPKPKSVR